VSVTPTMPMSTNHPASVRIRNLLALVLRFCVCLGVVLAALLGTASPASAHSAEGSPASNYRTFVDGITPRSDTFAIDVIEEGNRLELRWLSGDPIIVPGYDDEPYLRLGPTGVEENRRSPTTYLNRDRMGTTSPPADLDAEATPDWVRVSAEPVARFHDHRAHYMGSVPPQQVEARPNEEHLVQEFSIALTQGSQEHLVTGRVMWVPGQLPVAAIGTSVGLGVAVIALAVWAGVNADRRRLVKLPIIGALMMLVVVDVVHLLGIAGGPQGGSVLGRVFTIGYASIAAWVMALVSAFLWLQHREDALYLATFAAGLMTLVGGVADISILSKSAIVFWWPDTLARWSVALTLGLGVGLVVAAVLLTRPVTGQSGEGRAGAVIAGEAVVTG
jgi:hypothetical protein